MIFSDAIHLKSGIAASVSAVLLFCAFLSAGEWHKAEILYSDGTKENCSLTMMGSGPLIINCAPVREKKEGPEHILTNTAGVRVPDDKLALQDIVSIRMFVRNASMNRPWVWKESGKVDKVYLEGTYPFVDFGTEIRLVSGKVLKGNIISCAFRCRDGKKSKFFLSKQYKGKVGEKLEDMVYVREIRFAGRKSVAAKPLAGSVQDFGRLLEAKAVDRERKIVLDGRVKDNRFIFPDLMPGEYDVFLRTDEYVLSGFRGKPASDTALMENFKLADDFFKERKIVSFDGSRMLVYKRRSDFYDADKIVKGGHLWHLDLWYWHNPGGGEWKLDSRNVVLRRKQRGGTPILKLLHVPMLGGRKPGDSIQFREGENYEPQIDLE